jgi:putative transposase
LGVNRNGDKELLGLWVAQTEGAKFSLQVVTELKNRGVQDIVIACVDGLKGFPEAIEAVFPKTAVQLCIAHMVRYRLNFVGWKLRKTVAADLRTIYQAATVEEAEMRLAEFDAKWGGGLSFDRAVLAAQLATHRTFFDYPAEIRKVIYTTNAIESVNMSLRKVTKSRGLFPSDDALITAQHQQEMDDADSELEGGAESVHRHVR